MRNLMKDKLPYSIYILINGQNVPFYVGKTNNIKRRMRQHCNEVKKGNTLAVYNKLRKVLKENVHMNKTNMFKIIESDLSEKESDIRETYHIKKYTKKGIKLKNLTLGGTGAIGFTSLLFKKCLRTRKKNKNTKHSEETKLKISLSNKGVPKSKEHKKALSKGWEKRKKKYPNGISLEHRANASKTSKGKINIKIYKVTNPKGKVFYTTNGLTSFCEQNNLTQANMWKVANGDRDNHKGWMCEKTF